MTTSTQSIKHLSEKPWSDYTSADYSIEQWHNACLIHQHDGAPTSKEQCKLPVKTPSGVVNKNGVHSAAAALAGARGGVHASSEQKSSASKSLIRLYHQMNEDPPSSLMMHSSVEEFIEHFGVKGMHWGIRNKRKQPTISKGGKKKKKITVSEHASSLTDEDLRKAVSRMQLEQQYKTLKAKGHTTNIGARAANSILRSSGNIAANAAKETLKNMLAKRMQSALEGAISSNKKKNTQLTLFNETKKRR